MIFAIVIWLPVWLWLVIFGVVAAVAIPLAIVSSIGAHRSEKELDRRNAELQRPPDPDGPSPTDRQDW